MMDIEGSVVCPRCGVPFAADDQVVMAVPFREHDKRVIMGDELLVHEGCSPLPRHLREVGRGRYAEILEGIRSHGHAGGSEPHP